MKWFFLDVWRNKTVDGITYSWDYIIRPEASQEALPTDTKKYNPQDPPSEGSLPWSALEQHAKDISFGQLRSRPGWRAYLRCRAQSEATGQSAVSEWFRLDVIPADMSKFIGWLITSTFMLLVNHKRLPHFVHSIELVISFHWMF